MAVVIQTRGPLGPRASSLAVLLALSLAAGCRGQAAKWGEPVTLLMEASDPGAGFRIVFTARQPADPHSLVPQVAGLLNTAMKACSGFRSPSPKAPPQLEVELAGGSARARVIDPASGDAECLRRSIEAQKVELAAQAVLLVQVTKPAPDHVLAAPDGGPLFR